ncbi:hypothetical protein [Orenia marismortui]|uniref:hypothetical protein n=1 Tax=Orenia marismortui TaxID=46469 RepID=UPI00036DE5F6|nr:hypothetical protein [Orenia marismortui]
MNNNFIIASHGWSASNWLAYVLNQHEDIIASHSAANLINEKLSNDIKEKLKEFHDGYKNRHNIPIDKSYDYIENYGNAISYGSVHLYRLRDLPVQYNRFKVSKRMYNVVNLIRNPISLVWSGFGQFKDLFKTDINELYWTLGKVLEDKDFIYYICEKYKLAPGKYENLAFFGAARVLGSLKLDIDACKNIYKIPFINYMGEVKMEEITQNPKVLTQLIERVTDNKVKVTQEYLDNVYRVGKINKHKMDNKEFDPRERFESLERWKKETLIYYLKKFNIIQSYEKLGYNLSFVKPHLY